MKPTNVQGVEIDLYSQTREQNGQEFRRAAPSEIHVGQCVWINAYDPNVGRSWLEGPYFVTETIHENRMSEHFAVFSTHLNDCLLYTSPSPRDRQKSRMPSSA